MSLDWENILDEVLAGKRPRQDLADMLMRIDLPAEARTEIQEVLLLTDTLDQSMQAMTATGASLDALLARLRAEPMPVLPVEWTLGASIGPGDAEEALRLFLEGKLSRADLQRVVGRCSIDPELRDDIDAALKLSDRLDSVLSSFRLTEGMLQRLLRRLKGQTEDTGTAAAEEALRDRILKLGQESQPQRDVLAASEDAQEEEKNKPGETP